MTLRKKSVSLGAVAVLAALVLSVGCAEDFAGERLDCEGGKCDSIDEDWEVVFIPPSNGPAYIFPEDLADGMAWNAEYAVVRVDKEQEFVVVQGPHFVFDTGEWADPIRVELDDPWGKDLAFEAQFQRFTPEHELSGSIWFELVPQSEYRLRDGLWKLDIFPLPDKIHYYYHDYHYEHSFSSQIDDWYRKDGFRYFIAPYVIDSGWFSGLEGTYKRKIRVTCDDAPCRHYAQRDRESLRETAYLPTFCDNADDDARSETCKAIIERRR